MIRKTKPEVGDVVYSLLRAIVEAFFRLRYKFVVHNKEKLPPKGSGGYIIASNHQSYYDPPAIAAAVKGRFSFMAKKELFEKSGIFASLIRCCGAFPVDRGSGDNSAIERAISDLKKGRVFVIFPEGSRSRTGELGRAKSGAALIAMSADAPILPVCIVYGLGGNKRRIDIMIGDIIPESEIGSKNLSNVSEGIDRKELRRVSERIMGSIQTLRDQILKTAII